MSTTDHPDDSETPAVLEEGTDYYLENGLMVFTATFLRRRGYCCERGCRHCPYKEAVSVNFDTAAP